MGNANEFVERTQYLERQVGEGFITAGCTVNQVYAQNQHETLTFEHAVGRARYLGAPLMENSLALLQGIANSVVTETGSRLKFEMRDVAEQMSQYVFENAPRDPDIGDVLANSGSPFVHDDGVEIYLRPPIAPRRRDR